MDCQISSEDKIFVVRIKQYIFILVRYSVFSIQNLTLKKEITNIEN